MKILIIEDNDHKMKKITTYLSNRIPTLDLTEAKSYNSACKKIGIRKWDLIIIDMNIPTFDKSRNESGGELRTFGGKEIARRILRKSIESPFVLVTQFKKLTDSGRTFSAKQLNEEIHSFGVDGYLGMIMYDSVDTQWKADFDSLLTSFLPHD